MVARTLTLMCAMADFTTDVTLRVRNARSEATKCCEGPTLRWSKKEVLLRASSCGNSKEFSERCMLSEMRDGQRRRDRRALKERKKERARVRNAPSPQPRMMGVDCIALYVKHIREPPAICRLVDPTRRRILHLRRGPPDMESFQRALRGGHSGELLSARPSCPCVKREAQSNSVG